MKKLPTILIDRREQSPWTFGAVVVGRTKAPALPTMSATLGEGDYSVAGFQGRLVVERKNGADFLSSIGKQRARFDREIDRLKRYELAAIIVEGLPSAYGETILSWRDVLAGNYDSGIDPGSVLGTIGSFWGKSRVWTFFGESRQGAELAARSLLLKGAKHMAIADGWASSWRGHHQSRFRRRAA
jgi:hypothetical protein